MKNIFICLSLLFCLKSVAQNISIKDSLPISKKYKKGILENGLTYYLYNTEVTKKTASFYIIQNVGSVLEQENQQGLAHFLEHMAFNGTENFKEKGILNTLQKYGAVFGKDINAYTSFDETVYNINNIPVTEKIIDTCLLILKDWSNYLSLTEQEIDAERGVVKEEWRTRQNGGMRILQKQLPTIFNNSIYAQRMPIGKMNIIDNFEYSALRDFYYDWYRTDLQAIAIIGDINVDKVEEKVKELFSKIPAVVNPKERTVIRIPEHKEMLYSMAMDEEITTAQMSFNIRHLKKNNTGTAVDIKTSLINNMITTMLSARIREITQKSDAPFLNASINFSAQSRTTNAFSVQIAPKPNQQNEAFEKALIEVNRAVNFGFTQQELERTKIQFENFYENLTRKKEDISHSSIAQTIKQNYLENGFMLDVDDIYNIVKEIFKTLEITEVHQAMKDLYTKQNRYILVTGVKENKNLTKEKAIEIIENVENNKNLRPYSDLSSDKTLVSGINFNKGKIVSEASNDTIQSTTFNLENGIKVHYKFVDKNKNSVQLYAKSNGGLSLIEDSDLPSAYLLKNLVSLSGIGDYSPTELTKILAGKSAATEIGINSLSETISGSSVTKDVETLLQLVYLRFMKPRFDEDAFKVLMNNIDNYLIQRKNNVNEKIKDSITTTLYGYSSPKHRLFTKEFTKEISFEKIQNLYLERFANAADFEFFIVGDVQKEILKPMLEKYLGAISTNNTIEDWENNSEAWLKANIDKEINIPMKDAKSTVKIFYKKQFPYTLKNAFMASLLGDILQLRYTESLREEEGGTYGANVNVSLSKRPIEELKLSVSFDSSPDKAEVLAKIVNKEIFEIINGNLNQEDLNKTITNYIKERKQQKDYNFYDMSLLQTYFLEGYNLDDPKNFENILKKISKKDIELMTEKLLDKADTYQIIIKPDPI